MRLFILIAAMMFLFTNGSEAQTASAYASYSISGSSPEVIDGYLTVQGASMGTCTHKFTESLVLSGVGIYGNGNFNNAIQYETVAFTSTWNSLLNVGPDGAYGLATSVQAFCSCVNEQFYNAPQNLTIYPAPVINPNGVAAYPNGGAGPISTIEPGTTGQLAIYGSYLTEDGQDTSPVVNVSNGVTITGISSAGDNQLNVYYDATNASPGTASVTVQTGAGTSNPAGQILVGDLTPVITGLSNSSYVVGVPQNVTVTGSHFGSRTPQFTFPFAVSGYTISGLTDGSLNLGFTPTTPGSGILTLMAAGYGGQGFDPVPGAKQSALSPTVNSFPFSLSMQLGPINVSTGDTTDTIGVSANPSTVPFAPALSVTQSSNPTTSSCMSSLSFPSPPTGTGTVYAPVTASGGSNSCSGIFSVRANAFGAVSPANPPTQVIVPPQIMIRTLVGEAGSQTNPADQSMAVLLLSALNRFGDPAFGAPATWLQALVSTQYYGSANQTANGPAPELSVASSIFAGTTNINILGCEGIWSPTNSQFATLQTWSNVTAGSILDSDWPNKVGAPGLWNGAPKQAVIKGTVLNNARTGFNFAPAFVLIHKAPSATAMAVIAIP